MTTGGEAAGFEVGDLIGPELRAQGRRHGETGEEEEEEFPQLGKTDRARRHLLKQGATF